jgi:signal transduction histidine kinase
VNGSDVDHPSVGIAPAARPGSTTPAAPPPPPSIQTRLGRTLMGWSLVWSMAVALAVWLAARYEVEELLDDTLVASAEALHSVLPLAAPSPAPRPPLGAIHPERDRYGWQLIAADGTVLLRSALAPAEPLVPRPTAGFSDSPEWRTYGLALEEGGRWLYVAQTRRERVEAQAEVGLTAVLAALAIGGLGQIWLRYRVRHELQPLQRLSERLLSHDPAAAMPALGPAQRAELAPMHDALGGLGQRLQQRIAAERAFSAHAAHALRTPLAGIDAQLAVALQQAPVELQPRLTRIREAAARLQRVVAALIGLFRTGVTPEIQELDAESLVRRLPVPGLKVAFVGDLTVRADPDLLAAALANLLDNAERHGAHRIVIDQPQPQCLRLHDDGPGVNEARRDELAAALADQDYEGHTGLGLMLADRVARAHGGWLRLPATDTGFQVELQLGPLVDTR